LRFCILIQSPHFFIEQDVMSNITFILKAAFFRSVIEAEASLGQSAYTSLPLSKFLYAAAVVLVKLCNLCERGVHNEI